MAGTAKGYADIVTAQYIKAGLFPAAMEDSLISILLTAFLSGAHTFANHRVTNDGDLTHAEAERAIAELATALTGQKPICKVIAIREKP